jgi:uncharacterized protein YtpQ (UPF0354 family)
MKERMNFQEFKGELIKTISQMSDKDIMVVDAGDRLLIKREDLNTALFLDNAWKRYKSGEDFQTMAKLMIEPLLKQSERYDFTKMSWAEVKNRIMPQVKNLAFFKQSLAEKSKIVFRDDIIPGIGIGYVVDSDNGMAYVTNHILDMWGITPDILHAQAIANIKPYKKDIKRVELPDGLHYYIASTLDSYDAAKILILLEDGAEIQASFKGDMMVGIPIRDVLLIFDSEKPYVPFFAMQILEVNSKFPYPVSPLIFKWEKGKFVAGQIIAM